MTINSTARQMRRNFEAQFEADGEDKYFYRRNGKGQPIPVSADELARFIHQYIWRIRFTQAAMLVALSILLGMMLSRTPSSALLSEPLLYVGLGVIAVPAVALMYWVGAAPARVLEGRASVGKERSRNEMRAIYFKKLSYGQLALIALIGGWSVEYIIDGHWDRRWLFVPPTVVLIAAVQAFRKWRFEREHSGRL